jgi:hypothetical protein
LRGPKEIQLPRIARNHLPPLARLRPDGTAPDDLPVSGLSGPDVIRHAPFANCFKTSSAQDGTQTETRVNPASRLRSAEAALYWRCLAL